MKRNNYPVLILLLICFAGKALCQNHEISRVWVADMGNGSYKNPVLFADYSDPDAIRVGSDYYMVSSSFNCIPGLPILHSKDLVNWKVINYALKKLEPEEIYDQPQQGKGVWAPCIRYHNHEYYIYYPDPDYGIFMIKAASPEKEWSKPLLVLKGKGIIDPAPFWDADGKAYLATAWAASRAGINSLITVYRMNKSGTRVVDEGRHVYDGHETNPTVEGPKLYRRNGYYYIFCPAGGVTSGWQLVLRAKNIYGPYSEKVVMDQGKTSINGPHQGAYLETPDGCGWFLHFQDRGPYGRIIHLEPVKWVDNWPVIGNDRQGNGKGEPVSTFKKPAVGKEFEITTPDESDEFNQGRIGLQWQWQANQKIQWSEMLPGKGYLRLFAIPESKPGLWQSPNLLLQKLPALEFTATTLVKFNGEKDLSDEKMAGLLMMGNDYAYLAISQDNSGYFVKQVVCKDAVNEGAEEEIEQKRILSNQAYLKITIKGPEAECQFSYSDDGLRYQNIGKPFFAKPVKWTGAKVGIFCTAKPGARAGGFADFDWFRIAK